MENEKAQNNLKENQNNVLKEDVKDKENIINNQEDMPKSSSNEISEEDNKAIDVSEINLNQIQKNLIEGALYAAGRPLDIEELSIKLDIKKKVVETLINELATEYLERNSAIIIANVGEKYQMQLRPQYIEKISKFSKGGGIAEKYLRTLTIIALKQPILKSTLVKIRGSGAYEHVKYLIDNGLIKAVKKGRTFELTTTDKYSEMFGLPKDKEELKRIMIKQLSIE